MEPWIQRVEEDGTRSQIIERELQWWRDAGRSGPCHSREDAILNIQISVSYDVIQHLA